MSGLINRTSPAEIHNNILYLLCVSEQLDIPDEVLNAEIEDDNRWARGKLNL